MFSAVGRQHCDAINSGRPVSMHFFMERNEFSNSTSNEGENYGRLVKQMAYWHVENDEFFFISNQKSKNSSYIKS